MMACQKGVLKLVDLLIEQGTPVNIQDKYQKGPLFYVLDSGPNIDVASRLIREGK